jgi:protocatechuate 3,4-dioxygenase beta subunit
MPGGDLAAVRSDNSAVQLITYGMTEVNLTDNNGNPLQLKNGTEAEMTFPVPAGKDKNPPATIPLWYFDDDRGIWVEEGTATLKGNVYVGKVSHFSWHNIDTWEGIVIIKGKVTDCNNQPVKYVLVTVDETAAITGSTGEYSVRVPANTPVTVTVKSSDYDNYSPVVAYNVPGQPAGTTYTRDISLPCRNAVNPNQPTATIKGKVTDCKGEPVKNVVVTVGQTSVATGNTGDYSVQVPANTSVTVTVKKEDYGDYSPVVSHNVPGQPANSTYTRNISLPCLSTTDPEVPAGSFYSTKCARVKYLFSSGGTSYLTTLIFDDYGRRQRIESEIDGRVTVIIIDYIAKKYYVRSDDEWMDMTQYMPWEQMDFTASSQFSAEQQTNGYNITITGTETIAGRACTVYTIKGAYTDPDTGSACDIRTANWRGIAMMVELCGQVMMIAQEASLEIPANSFTPR